MTTYVLLTGARKARTRPNQVLTLTRRPCRTVTSFGMSDNAMAQTWLASDAGSVPIPPPELLADEPADSPIWKDVAQYAEGRSSE